MDEIKTPTAEEELAELKNRIAVMLLAYDNGLTSWRKIKKKLTEMIS